VELCVRAAAYTHKGEVKSEPSNSETGIPFDHRFAALADALQTTTRRYFHSPALKAPEHRNKRQNRGFLPLGKGVVTHPQNLCFFLIKIIRNRCFSKKVAFGKSKMDLCKDFKSGRMLPGGSPSRGKIFPLRLLFPHLLSGSGVKKRFPNRGPASHFCLFTIQRE